MSCQCQSSASKSNASESIIDLALLEPVLKQYGNEQSHLITILQKAQDIYGYLPGSVMQFIAESTGIKASKIYGVATFYTQFRLKPVGKYLIMLCQGTACHVNGASKIERAICEFLQVQEGETTGDGLFTLNNVACLGCCSLAPVMMINGETYAKLTPDSVVKILEDIRKNDSVGEVLA